MAKTQTIIYDDNGGYMGTYDGTCALSPDGSVWRIDIDNTGVITTEKLG